MQGIKAVEPICAETDVEFSVPKVIGSVGGRSTSNGFPVVPSNEFMLTSTISAVTAAGYSETNRELSIITRDETLSDF